MQPQIVQGSGPFVEDMSSALELFESCGFNLDPQFSSSEDTSETSSIHFGSAMFCNDQFQYQFDEDVLKLPSLTEDFPTDWDFFDTLLNAQIVGICGYPEESEGSSLNSQIVGSHGYPEESEGSFLSQNLSSEGEYAWSPSPSMKSENSTFQLPLTLPLEDMEIENRFSLPHLLEAHGEALEKGHKTLAEVILRCISQKVSPFGDPIERLAFNLSKDITSLGDSIRLEAGKNFESALRAIYQSFPHGKFAHYTANSAITEARPQDSEVIHIVDFDMGEGLQWPPLMEGIAHHRITLKLTSIKLEDDSSECPTTPWNFEETKKNLYEHAKYCGISLTVEEKKIEELVMELKKMYKRGGGKREYLAFNCQLGLPHMGRVKSRRNVMEFLRVARDFINSSVSKGIIVLGDGDAYENLRNCLNFRSFFDGQLVHYKALLESIESSFPKSLSEARIAMESLFVAPYVSSLAWLQKWEEIQESCHLEAEIGLVGHKLSNGTLMELLRGCGGSYEARIEGNNGNEVVLEWKGIQLVRVSTWAGKLKDKVGNMLIFHFILYSLFDLYIKKY